jgi:predicted transcriptional regulator
MTRKPRSPKGVVERFTVSLSPEAAAKLEAYCQKNERPRSWVVEKLITFYLEKMP